MRRLLVLGSCLLAVTACSDATSGREASVDVTQAERSSSELEQCVRDLRASAAGMDELLAEGESLDQVSDDQLRSVCANSVLPAQASAQAAAGGVVNVPVSPACDQAMAVAAAEPDGARADPLIVATLTACTAVDEWLSALRTHPAALGLTGPEYVSDLDLQAACGADRETPVCAQAAAMGRLGR